MKSLQKRDFPMIRLNVWKMMCGVFILCAATVLVFASLASASVPASKTLHQFNGSPNDGAYPQGALLADKLGNLYGTTAEGGNNGFGSVFRLAPPSTINGIWIETVLYSFAGGADGWGPVGDLVADSEGNLYGTTGEGGGSANCVEGCGTIFQLTPSSAPGGAWTESVLHSFQGSPNDGAYPNAGLTLDHSGSLYGTTGGGGNKGCSGTFGCGTVFKLNPPAAPGGAWTGRLLYRFQPGSETFYPLAGVILDKAGNLYGTTFDGNPGGAVFELTPPSKPGGAWVETVLYTFNLSGDAGLNPRSSLIFDKAGNLYGTASVGGDYDCGIGDAGCGTVFELTPPSIQGGAWTETTIYVFTGLDGNYPWGRLIFDKLGNLYGTTALGGGYFCASGDSGCGTVFELSPPSLPGEPWTEVTLYTFTDAGDGGFPVGGLVFGKLGALYGTAGQGGNLSCNPDMPGCGTVFGVLP
jgi:uncharacterized repeat protein (TIGR03803 family)